MNVHLRHVRSIRQANGKRLCLSGVRGWCELTGIDYAALASPEVGVSEEAMAATGDDWALQSIAKAHEENPDG